LARSGWRLGLERPPTSGLAASAPQQGGSVDSAVSLRYPNGRLHEATLTKPGELMLGDRFELYGRQWSAVELLKVSRWAAGAPRRMLCISTSHMSVPPR
jgi:hypothetical protein